MSISITTADVKRKAMIASADTTYDSAIGSLITEMQSTLEYSIADVYLNNTGATGLQATLKLGMLEIISGEFLEQLRNEFGRMEQVVVGGVTLGPPTPRGADLIQQGATRLQPYLKAALPMLAESDAQSTTEDAQLTFESHEEVW